MRTILFLSLILFVSVNAFSQALHLYGGDNHDIYLGCINSCKQDENSIWNEKGCYGSKNNPHSIWNESGEYGCEKKSCCPWNENATTPPMIKDKRGKKYGYLTVNKSTLNRAEFTLALQMYKHHSDIRKDLSLWYDKIFR